MIRKRVIVHGRVQGVGFRWYTQATANQLGLGGFVRNLPGGTVEVEFEGEPTAVAEMVSWLRSGPSYAHVTRIEVMNIHPKNETSFDLRY